uniref:Uncharacterized protein n=1 Tax=Oryza rufipogon TaxID=4529 RepID=A0A0E0N6E7_ORYRU
MEMDKFSSSYQPSWPPAQATVDVVGSVETYAARQEEEVLGSASRRLRPWRLWRRRRRRRFGKVRVRGLVVTVAVAVTLAEEGRS